MKSKRKLVPKSTAVSDIPRTGQGVGPSVSPKRQCICQSDSELRCDPQLQVSGMAVANIDGEQRLQLTSAGNVNRHSVSNRGPCVVTIQQPVALASVSSEDALSNRTSRSHIRWESTTGGDSLHRQPRCSGPPLDYKHIGSRTYSYEHCGALFWYEERIRLCENIRAYNQMFSMTSLGAHIDESINNGRGLTAHEKFEDMHIPDFKVQFYNVVGAREYELPIGDMLGAILYEAGPEMEMDYDIGDNDGSNCGARLILPQSFTGGPRYMYRHYLDALAICHVHGNP
ncbi:hypothetical protein Tco_0083828 [Tanacetum coccineum]